MVILETCGLQKANTDQPSSLLPPYTDVISLTIADVNMMTQDQVQPLADVKHEGQGLTETKQVGGLD